MFQSTPVIADGRSKFDGDKAALDKWFQSTPVIADGRSINAQGDNLTLGKFQSTPVIADGRSACFLVAMGVPCRFNPRPSLLTGEACHAVQQLSFMPVSIHARHC